MKFFDLFRTNNKVVLSNAAADGSRPALTVRQAEKLLGEKIDYMVMYNMNTFCPLKDTYNSQRIIYGGRVSERARGIKDMYAQSKTFGHRKPMWVVAKSVSTYFDKGDLFDSVPPYDEYGRLIIGNVIFYDTKLQKYKTLYPNGAWFRVGIKSCASAAAEEAICNTLAELCYRIR